MMAIMDGEPRWRTFTRVIVAAGIALLWSVGVPGDGYGLLFLVAVVVLVVSGVVWLLRLIRAWWRGSGWSWWFVVGPVWVLILGLLIAAGVPLTVRWEISRPWFEAQVADLPPVTFSDSEDWQGRDVPPVVGLYRIESLDQAPAGVIFYEATGSSWFDNAGFAYLPAGPQQSLATGWFEDPQFRHLGGRWYAWTASW
jgi:hypothetical protein